MIVITYPTEVANEIAIIHSLFENGLKLLHIRKPEYSETKMAAFLTALGNDYSSRLVLHSHHHLADASGIKRFHFTKEAGNNPFRISNPKRVISASTHSVQEFNALEDHYDYAFLSPVFPSISKTGYQSSENLVKSIENRTNLKTKLIALGGISPENIPFTLSKGFNGVALLGAIWNTEDPLKNFKKCQQTVHSF